MAKKMRALNFEGLVGLDEGRVAKLLLLHLDRVSQDIYNRPHEMGEREIILSLKFKPKKTINNEPSERVNCTIDCKTKTPIWRTSEYDMRLMKVPRGNGGTQYGFEFSDAYADNMDANPLPFDEE